MSQNHGRDAPAINSTKKSSLFRGALMNVHVAPYSTGSVPPNGVSVTFVTSRSIVSPYGFSISPGSSGAGAARSIASISIGGWALVSRRLNCLDGDLWLRENHCPPSSRVSERYSNRLHRPRVISEIEPSHVLSSRVLDREVAGMLDHAPWPWKTERHSSGFSRRSTSRPIICAASAPDIILPICVGGTDVIILALSS